MKSMFSEPEFQARELDRELIPLAKGKGGMVRFVEGPLGVQAEVRHLQTNGNAAHIDQEGSAATSQRVHEKIEAERVRYSTSLIYIHILRMQSSVQGQRVGLGTVTITGRPERDLSTISRSTFIRSEKDRD